MPANFCPSNGFPIFPGGFVLTIPKLLSKIFKAYTAEANGFARHVADVVIPDEVVPALPQDNRMAVPIDFANMMDQVVGDNVMLVDILCSRPITDQDNASLAQMTYLVVCDLDVLAMVIQAYRVSSAVDKDTIMDFAVLGRLKESKRCLCPPFPNHAGCQRRLPARCPDPRA